METLLMTTADAETGRPRTTRVAYRREENRYLVPAPDVEARWYRDLGKSPQATIEIDGVPHAARAVPFEGGVALHPLEVDAVRGRAIADQLLVHHGELRKALAAARAELDGHLPGESQALHRELLGHCVTFCNGLRMHHLREDGAFTAIEKAHPGLGPALTRLREEHEVVSRALLDLDKLLQGKEELESPALREEFERVAAGLEDHFAYEEANLLPALRGDGTMSRP
ncbi:nitroreductase/quinone reductase family protein [Amycolatopsis sp. NPDC051071]|uniref:nitroreductase/quinone reductase family protein n=1 Tax=Amycolatopsis sp. NPDC051071 TaxID=3154637 RepID=UPI0034216249